MADVEHISVNGDVYDISDSTARSSASTAQGTASDAAIAAARAQSTADQAELQLCGITFSFNSDDAGLDITID